MKILIVTSPGGHIFQTYLLKKWWQKHDRVWVTHDTVDVKYLLKNEKVIYSKYLKYRSLWSFIFQAWFAFRVLVQEKPNFVFSMGSGIAVPYFWLAKLFQIKTIFIEVYDFIDSPSLTARLIAPFTWKVLVQHKSLKNKIRGAIFQGSVI